MNSDLVLVNVRICNEEPVSICIKDGSISEISSIIEADHFLKSGFRAIDCHGAIALPGLVDMHTHLREPGNVEAETVLSGSQSAVKGGFTAVTAMANTQPVADNAGVVELIYRKGQEAGLCDVFPIGAVTRGLAGVELSEILAMNNSTASVRVFSDDGHCVSDSLVMRRALEYVKSFDGVIAQHAQDPQLTIGAQMNEGIVSSEIGLTGWPSVAEEAVIARDVLLAEMVDSRIHICHVSTAGSVELIRWAKKRGIKVTAEVTPHHLLLTDELARSYDPIYKVNPPLRTAVDVQALRAGLADGTIDIVATDHAPHTSEAKECEWGAAAYGMIGLETALSIVIKTMVQSGLMSWKRLSEVMSTNPAEIAGYQNQGQDLRKGAPANVLVLDPSSTWEIELDEIFSKSTNTPFKGIELPGSVLHTIYRGVPVLINGQLTGEKYG